MYNEQAQIEAWENEGGLVQEVTETEPSGASEAVNNRPGLLDHTTATDGIAVR